MAAEKRKRCVLDEWQCVQKIPSCSHSSEMQRTYVFLQPWDGTFSDVFAANVRRSNLNVKAD